jgi:hypothetical protein
MPKSKPRLQVAMLKPAPSNMQPLALSGMSQTDTSYLSWCRARRGVSSVQKRAGTTSKYCLTAPVSMTS